MQLHLIFILIMSLLLVVFTFQNPYPVQMHFMGWQSSQIPIVVVVLISMLTGVIVSLILGLKQQNQLKKEIRNLKTELNELKTPSVNSNQDEISE